MGRIKSSNVKNLSKDLMSGPHKDKFTNNFQSNKEAVSATVETTSKKHRNIIAGYITRVVGRIKKQGA